MAVLNSCMKAYAVIAQFFLQILNQYICFFCRYMSGGVILQNISFHTNQITAHCHLARFQIHTNTGSFQRSATFIYLWFLLQNEITITAQQYVNLIQVAIAQGFHLFPFRTEKLSLVTPMVLRHSGRVGSRRFD